MYTEKGLRVLSASVVQPVGAPGAQGDRFRFMRVTE